MEVYKCYTLFKHRDKIGSDIHDPYIHIIMPGIFIHSGISYAMTFYNRKILKPQHYKIIMLIHANTPIYTSLTCHAINWFTLMSLKEEKFHTDWNYIPASYSTSKNKYKTIYARYYGSLFSGHLKSSTLHHLCSLIYRQLHGSTNQCVTLSWQKLRQKQSLSTLQHQKYSAATVPS